MVRLSLRFRIVTTYSRGEKEDKKEERIDFEQIRRTKNEKRRPREWERQKRPLEARKLSQTDFRLQEASRRKLSPLTFRHDSSG